MSDIEPFLPSSAGPRIKVLLSTSTATATTANDVPSLRATTTTSPPSPSPATRKHHLSLVFTHASPPIDHPARRASSSDLQCCPRPGDWRYAAPPHRTVLHCRPLSYRPRQAEPPNVNRGPLPAPVPMPAPKTASSSPFF